MSKLKLDDSLVLNREGVDYKITIDDLVEYLQVEPEPEPKPPMPWDDHHGAVFHIKDATGPVKLNMWSDVYGIDGTYKGNTNSVDPGEEVVILANETMYFFTDNYDTTWNFGELTDVSKADDFHGLFWACWVFNGTGMSDWDTSHVAAVGDMDYVFRECANFNQDISQWCVNNVRHLDFATGATSFEAKNQPVWGTCPRGEDQL